MNHIRHRLILAGAILLLAVSGAWAQTAPTAPSTPAAPGAPGLQAPPPPMTASPPQEKVMDGPVKQVDPLGKSLSVGWLFGLFSTTLEVTEDTRIAVEGATGSLQDIREGDVVKAAYEVRDGKNIATAIEVTEAEPRRATSAPPQGAPAPSSAPAMGAPQGSAAPSTDAPQTP